MRTFDTEIISAVATIDHAWRGKGYDIGSYFTHDLPYGPHCCVKANHPPLTMCVAAVAEIIIEALNAYHAATGDKTPFEKLPLRSWRGGAKRDIRAHIFMYEGVGSNGTAHALERFGIGKQMPFEKLKPGGFINFNRSRSGHACVFLSYIDANGADLAAYSDAVVGFRYFSSQGRGMPDAGFGYRWGFFDSYCSSPLSGGRRRDCGIIRSARPNLLCCGHMLHPESWPAAAQIAEGVVESLSKETEGMAEMPEGAIEQEMSRELPEPDFSRFDGVTTD